MGAIGQLSDADVFPLSTLDPTAPLDDLEPLENLIGDTVQVVAVGESAHGAHEYYALRHRIIRFLVERMNFTALAWESGFPEAFLIDDYIHGRQHDRERALVDGMTMNMGLCQEMADLVDWLRAHNSATTSTQGAVRFYGLDLPGSSASLAAALAVVAPYVERVDPGFRPRLTRLEELAASFAPSTAEDSKAKLVLVGTAVIYQYVALAAMDRNELTALLADLAARFDALRRTYVERSDVTQYDIARQQLRVAAQLDVQLRAVAAFMAGDAAACEANIRDVTMADTVEWVRRRHERIIVLAHNGHIQRTPISTMPGVTPVDTLGVHLTHRLGDRYRTIGTTCGGGEIIVPRTTNVDGKFETELIIRDLPPAGDDTIDGMLDSNLAPGTADVSLLDLRTLGPQSASAIDAARRMRVQDQTVDIDVRRSFDMLVHVRRISLWTSTFNTSLPDERTEKASAKRQVHFP